MYTECEVRYSGGSGDWRTAETRLTNDIPVHLAGQELEYLGRAGGRVHEEIDGGGGGEEVAREIFILSSGRGSLAVWDAGGAEADDNPCDPATRHLTATGGSRPMIEQKINK